MAPKKGQDIAHAQSALSSPAAQGAHASSSGQSMTINCDTVDLITKITAAFTSSFQACVDKIIDAIDKKLSSRLDTHEVQMFDINKRLDKLTRTCDDLGKENDSLRDTLVALNARVEVISIACDDNEQYSRSANLLIHGIPTPSDNSTESNVDTAVADILSTNLGLSISASDFTSVHRLPRDRHQGASGPPRPPPIIVQFVSKRVRSAVLLKRRALKGKSFSISEQLTPRRMSLLRKANDCVKAGTLGGAWSHDGKIFIKTLADRTITINSASDLDQFLAVSIHNSTAL